MYNNNYIERLVDDISYLKGFQAWVKKEEPYYSKAGHEALEERIINLKRELRKEYRRQEKDLERNKREYSSDDGTSTRCFFDEWFDSPEDAREWAEETWKDGQIYADYSPTGKWFVSDARVAHIEGNRYRCYIAQSLDI